MQPTNPPVSVQKAGKTWHAPQCTKKAWQTPKVVAVPFGDTRTGTFHSIDENLFSVGLNSS